MDDALLGVNAAAACRRLYGGDHPSVGHHAERAAESLRTLAERSEPLKIIFLSDKVVFGGASLGSGDRLKSGVFARLGSDLPDCLEVNRAVSRACVLRLIDALEGTTELDNTLGVRLRWVTAEPSGAPARSAPLVVGDPRFYAHELRTAWDQTARRGAAPVASIQQLAGDVVAAVTSASATLLPMADLKSHDEYTYIHAINVGVMSSALARAAGLPTDRVFDITCAALLHDVGKGAIPLEILNKRGKLDEAERARMNSHPAEGAAILASSPGLPPVAVTVAYEHHMKINGGGYPNMPAGWKISLASQIVHIADVFDALRTHRPYRKALSLSESLEILGRESGVAFDAELYRVFVDRVVSPANASRDSGLAERPDDSSKAA